LLTSLLLWSVGRFLELLPKINYILRKSKHLISTDIQTRRDGIAKGIPCYVFYLPRDGKRIKSPRKKSLWMPLSANLFRLEFSILTRAKRATNRNNVATDFFLSKLRFFFSGGIWSGGFCHGDFIREPFSIYLDMEREMFKTSCVQNCKSLHPNWCKRR